MRSFFSTVIFAFIFSISSSYGDISERRALSIDENQKITIYEYFLMFSELDEKKLLDSIACYSMELVFEDDKYICFSETGEYNPETGCMYPYSMNGDSLFFWGEYCPNIGKMEFKYNGEIVCLIKSDYDTEGIDEESYIYWNVDYGLVAQYNYAWGILILFDKETMKGFAKEIFYDNFILQEIKKK